MCFRCGGTNHMSKDCKFAKEKCYKYGKIGHVKRVCRMKPQESASNKGKKTLKWERGKLKRGLIISFECNQDIRSGFRHRKLSLLPCCNEITDAITVHLWFKGRYHLYYLLQCRDSCQLSL